MLFRSKRQSSARIGPERFVAQAAQALGDDDGRIMLISFVPEVLEAARDHGYPIGYCVDSLTDAERTITERLGPDVVLFDHTTLEMQSQLWPGEWRYGAWEVETSARAQQLWSWGVHYVESMIPERLVAEGLIV